MVEECPYFGMVVNEAFGIDSFLCFASGLGGIERLCQLGSRLPSILEVMGIAGIFVRVDAGEVAST
jgi:hypothetical protein